MVSGRPRPIGIAWEHHACYTHFNCYHTNFICCHKHFKCLSHAWSNLVTYIILPRTSCDIRSESHLHQGTWLHWSDLTTLHWLPDYTGQSSKLGGSCELAPRHWKMVITAMLILAMTMVIIGLWLAGVWRLVMTMVQIKSMMMKMTMFAEETFWKT